MAKARKKKVPKYQQRLKQEKAVEAVQAILVLVAVVAVILLLIMLAIGLVVIFFQPDNPVPVRRPVVAQQSIVQLPPAQIKPFKLLDENNPQDTARIEQLRKFWLEVLDPIVFDQVLSPEFVVPEVSQRISLLQQTVKQRFSKEIIYKATLNYSNRKSPEILAEAGLGDNQAPMCQFLVAALYDKYQELQVSGEADWEKIFINKMVITVEHELEHLAFSQMVGSDQLNHQQLTVEEARIWHNSCKYVIGPLIQYNPRLVDKNMTSTYETWLHAGQAADDPRWLKYISLVKIHS